MDKINDAIRRCLGHCEGTHDPMGTVMRCLRELRHDPNWTEDDILQVRNGVTALLMER
jgi:hypothetical protein